MYAMKRLKLINKGGLFLAFGFFWIFLNSFSQEAKVTRQERKETRKAELNANFHVLDSLFETKSFVLEANYLENKYGDQIPVSSMVNFIMVNSTNGVLQTGNNSTIGYNGLGGVTAEGSIGSWKLDRDYKNLNFTLRFSILTDIGSYDVFLTVNADNRARATITGLWPGKLIYNGYLNTLGNTGVFKGQRTTI
jgi:hypothetical protein